MGFAHLILQGAGFRHAAYLKKGAVTNGVLHVYLEGDGAPFIDGRAPSADPTPANPLMLRLMALDPNPALYLGRPCYFGLSSTSPSCHPYYWTSGRYSSRVVESMAAALGRFLKENRYDGVVFLGHSGGGVLAMLLAPYFKETIAVVTAASNLDIDAWCERRGYGPLTGSLNPATRPALPKSIRQLHYAGGRDENVPPELIEPVVSFQENATFTVMDDFDHACCWGRIWPSILKEIRK
ncbi:MAG: alpha/beta hydrolase [Desulfobacterales bacterium]|nr:alpha/beta hydrolase [Desulfobacterales bacterium]